MAGLNLGVNGGVRATANGGSAPTSASEAGFGPGYTAAGTPSGMNALTPNDPFGVAFWTGVGALAFLFVIRKSLPR